MQLKIKEPIADYILSNNDIKLGGFVKIKLVNNDFCFDFNDISNIKIK